MRQIGTIPHENLARRFMDYLRTQGISAKCDVVFGPQDGQMSYQIWIQDEDRLEEASQLLQEFEKSPLAPKFDAPEREPEPILTSEEPSQAPHQFKTYLTYFLIALCSLIYFVDVLQRFEIAKKVDASVLSRALTPIQEELMYDLPPENNGPYWKGIYSWGVAKIKGENTSSFEGPLFTYIRQGDVWRLFTPCLLHKDLLHILFNMLWLWYLGRPIEQRIGPLRLLILTVIAGVLTNTMQYLMSGPLFIGYSGVVTALAGFIWMREKIAPWEGYPLTRATIFFLLFFILAILGLQIVSLALQLFTSYTFAPNIANTAHIAGMIIGAILARFHFFAQRVKS